jgi:hypothetical protein
VYLDVNGNCELVWPCTREYFTNSGSTWNLTFDRGSRLEPDAPLTIALEAGGGQRAYGFKLSSFPLTEKYQIVSSVVGTCACGAISVSGTQLYSPGAKVTYYIFPNSGFIIESVNVDGVNVGTDAFYTFTNIAASHVLQVQFILMPTLYSNTWKVGKIQGIVAERSRELQVIGGSPSIPVVVATSTPEVCSITAAVVIADTTKYIGAQLYHELTWQSFFGGLSIGTCAYTVNSGSNYFSGTVQVVGQNELGLGNGASGGNYVGQTLNLPSSLGSGRKVSYENTTPTNCSLEGEKVLLLKYGYCILNYSAAGTSIYAPFSATYSIGVNANLQQTLTLNVPATLSRASTPYFLSYSLSTPNGASELKPTVTVDNPSVCTVTEGPLLKQFKINLLSTGTCTITASQPGNNAQYTASNTVVITVTVTD